MSLEQVVDDIKDEANAEAEEIRADAEKRAEAIIDEAEADAEAIKTERAAEVDAKIEQEREQAVSGRILRPNSNGSKRDGMSSTMFASRSKMSLPTSRASGESRSRKR